ncbi:MAG: hypothetical protein ACE5HB_05370, partial [Terriglobia bacterium]
FFCVRWFLRSFSAPQIRKIRKIRIRQDDGVCPEQRRRHNPQDAQNRPAKALLFGRGAELVLSGAEGHPLVTGCVPRLS